MAWTDETVVVILVKGNEGNVQTGPYASMAYEIGNIKSKLKPIPQTLTHVH
jgi:hypothetical protein